MVADLRRNALRYCRSVKRAPASAPASHRPSGGTGYLDRAAYLPPDLAHVFAVRLGNGAKWRSRDGDHLLRPTS